MLRKTLAMSAALMFATAVSGQAQDMMKGETMKGEMMNGGVIKFTVRIENISSPDGMRVRTERSGLSPCPRVSV